MLSSMPGANLASVCSGIALGARGQSDELMTDAVAQHRRCPRCRARLPRSIDACPVCAGRCGNGPELLMAEQQRRTERLARERSLPFLQRWLFRIIRAIWWSPF
jgi:hypothetical protein